MWRNAIKIIGMMMMTFLQAGAQQTGTGHYASVNGLKMYYEIHGTGNPLVLLHGGGSTINTTFGRVLPLLAKHHKVIAVELQAHGRTKDIDRPLSFEHDADDVAALLRVLKIPKADFLGFSNGGTTCMQIAIRHPQLVNKLVLGSAIYKRSGMPAGFFDGMEKITLSQMPPPLKTAFLEVNPDMKGFEAMFHRDVARMVSFKDIPDEAVKGIQAPTLVINGDAEAIQVSHAVEISRNIPNAQLLIVPGGHGDYIGEICTPYEHNKMPALVMEMVEIFLKG